MPVRRVQGRRVKDKVFDKVIAVNAERRLEESAVGKTNSVIAGRIEYVRGKRVDAWGHSLWHC